MKNGPQYRKLPGVGHGLGSYSRLYLGSDHLLQVSSTAFSERYKRFYFRDVQAIVILRTTAWVWFIAGLGAFGGLMLFIALLSGNAAATWVLSVIAGIFLASAVVQALRGPSCRTFIRTAVQTERLPSLHKLRRAEQVLAIIKPSLDAAQSSLAASPAEPQTAAPADAAQPLETPQEPSTPSP